MSKNARLTTEQLKQPNRNQPSRSKSTNQHPLRNLQHNVGNHATQQALNSPGIQAKLSVNPPGDVYEQEADRMAASLIQQEHTAERNAGSNASVMRQTEEDEESIQAKPSNSLVFRQEEEEEAIQMKRIAGFVQRQEEEEYAQMKQSPNAVMRQEEQEEEELIQAKSSRGTIPQVNNALEQRINSAHGGGQRLPPGVSSSFEPQLGHDLSQVRVHTGSEAHSLSRSLQAEAFTTGNDIFFRSGRYDPSSESGRGLIAHEVTHVVQQGVAPALRKEE